MLKLEKEKGFVKSIVVVDSFGVKINKSRDGAEHLHEKETSETDRYQ